MKTLQEQIDVVSVLIENCSAILKNRSQNQIKNFYNRLYSISKKQSEYLIDICDFTEKRNSGYSGEIKKLSRRLETSKQVITNALLLKQSIQTKKNLVFDFIKILGYGGNGTVFLVNEQSTNTQFALKQLRLKDSKKNRITKKQLSRFNDEIIVVTNSLQTNIGVLPIIDFNVQSFPLMPDDYSWYTMPIATPIYDYVFTDVKNKIEAFYELSTELKSFHDQGITHRDIKPENLYYYNDHFVFSDFGLTDFPQKTTRTDIKEHIGPWQTIAPEMERDVENADFKAADVYSFAKTFWMILTNNKDCFEGQYSFTTDYMDLSRYLKTRATYNSGIKIYLAPLHELLYYCTSNKPSERFPIDKVIEYFLMWMDFAKNNRRGDAFEWNFLQKQLFRSNVRKAIWDDIDSIVTVLDIATRTPYLNHTFFPGKGGLYLNNIKKYSKEYIELDFGMPYIGKPKKLEFHAFPISLFNYFYLEMDDFGGNYSFHKYSNKLPYEEEVCEISNKIFRESWLLNYEQYDGFNVPKTARKVYLLNKGIYVIFCESSPYNLDDHLFGFDSYSANQIRFCTSEKFEKFITVFHNEYYMVAKKEIAIETVKKFNELEYPRERMLFYSEKSKKNDAVVENFLKASLFYNNPFYDISACYNYYLKMKMNSRFYVFTTNNKFVEYDNTITLSTYYEDKKRIEQIESTIKYFSSPSEIYILIRNIKRILKHHFKNSFSYPNFYLEGKFVKLPMKRYFSFDDVKNALLSGNDTVDSYIAVAPDMSVLCIEARLFNDSTRGLYCIKDYQCINAHDDICGNKNLNQSIIINEYNTLLAKTSVILKELVNKSTTFDIEIMKKDTDIKKELDSL